MPEELKVTIGLGAIVRDTTTQFSGTVTAVCRYMSGTADLRVETLTTDGTLIERWIDSQRLVLVDEKTDETE